MGKTKDYLCKFCGEFEPLNFYAKLKLKSICKKCHTRNSHQVQRELKYRAITYLGGGCGKCGYQKCASALEFHHVDPKEKDFSWGDKRTSNWEKLVVELDKCVLLCSNCHKEEHDAIWCESLEDDHPEKLRRQVVSQAR